MASHFPIIPFVPRTTNNCLDLAVRYVGRFLPVVLGMWLLVALPTTMAVYVLSLRGQMDLRLVLVLVYFATLPLGVLVMNDAVPRIFGHSLKEEPPEPSSSRNAIFGVSLVLVVLGLGGAFLAENLGDRMGLSMRIQTWSVWGGLGLAGFVVALYALASVARYQKIDWGTARMFFFSLCIRSVCAVGPALAFFPPVKDWRLGLLLVVTMITGLWLGLRTGFALEQACLTRLDPALQNRVVKTLLREEVGELLGRATWMAQYACLLWIVAFISVDAAASLIFRTPIFLGRLADLPPGASAGDYLAQMGQLLVSDPRVLATLTATALLVYPINRLAWFFCYIDMRVRGDCWDLELKFAQETERLETQT